MLYGIGRRVLNGRRVFAALPVSSPATRQSVVLGSQLEIAGPGPVHALHVYGRGETEAGQIPAAAFGRRVPTAKGTGVDRQATGDTVVADAASVVADAASAEAAAAISSDSGDATCKGADIAR